MPLNGWRSKEPHALKIAGLFQPKFGSNMDKPKCWVKNAIKTFAVESESWSWVKIWIYIFNPTFGFVHIWPSNPALFLGCTKRLWRWPQWMNQCLPKQNNMCEEEKYFINRLKRVRCLLLWETIHDRKTCSRFMLNFICSSENESVHDSN